MTTYSVQEIKSMLTQEELNELSIAEKSLARESCTNDIPILALAKIIRKKYHKTELSMEKFKDIFSFLKSLLSDKEQICRLETILFYEGFYSPEEIISILNKKTDNRIFKAFKYLGIVYNLLGDYNEAIKNLNKALELYPDDEEIKAELEKSTGS